MRVCFNPSLFYAASGVSVLSALAVPAHAVIKVNSAVELAEGVRAQAVITESTGFNERGDTIEAVWIKEVHSTILLRDLGVPGRQGDSLRQARELAGDVGGGLSVQKRQLTSLQTYGQGHPNGWPVPPQTDEPPFFGLVWPFRDQYDYFPGPNDPIGDLVGTPFFDQPDVYGFVDVDGIARGGPTDPVPIPGGDGGDGVGGIDFSMRGIDGNGLNGPASYFVFDVNDIDGPLTHLVRLRIFAAQATVVVREIGTNNFSEIIVPIPDFEIIFPEPGSLLSASAIAGALMLRRRRGGITR